MDAFPAFLSVSGPRENCILPGLPEKLLEGLGEVGPCIHPGVSAFCEHLLVGNALAVKILLMVNDIFVEEVGGADAEPVELELADPFLYVPALAVPPPRRQVCAV